MNLRVGIASMAVIFALVLSACAAPTPTPAPPKPAAPAPTTAPAAPKPAAPAPTAAPAAPKPAAPAPTTAPAAKPTTAPAAKAPAQLKEMQIGLVSWNSNYFPLIVAHTKGMFEQEGIKPDIVLAGNSPSSVSALVGGSVQIGVASGDSIVAAMEKDAPLVIIAGTVNKPHLSLVTQPEITKVEQLKGQTLAAAAIKGGGSAALTRIMLSAHGLTVDKDYTIIQAGSVNERYAAMTNKTVAGTAIFEPETARLVDAGFRVTERAANVLKDYQLIVYVANKPWLSKNEGLTVSFIKAVNRGTAYMYDPKNKEEVIKLLAERLKVEEKYARGTYDSYVTDMQIYPKAGEITIPGFKESLRIMGEQGDLKPPLPDPTKYLDLSYLQKATAQR